MRLKSLLVRHQQLTKSQKLKHGMLKSLELNANQYSIAENGILHVERLKLPKAFQSFKDNKPLPKVKSKICAVNGWKEVSLQANRRLLGQDSSKPALPVIQYIQAVRDPIGVHANARAPKSLTKTYYIFPYVKGLINLNSADKDIAYPREHPLAKGIRRMVFKDYYPVDVVHRRDNIQCAEWDEPRLQPYYGFAERAPTEYNEQSKLRLGPRRGFKLFCDRQDLNYSKNMELLESALSRKLFEIKTWHNEFSLREIRECRRLLIFTLNHFDPYLGFESEGKWIYNSNPHFNKMLDEVYHSLRWCSETLNSSYRLRKPPRKTK